MSTSLPFPDHFFDVIAAISSIEHFSDDGDIKAMGEFVRVLKRDGLVLLSFPYYFSKVSILGKRIINKEVLTRASCKRKLLGQVIAKSSQIDMIRLIARSLHWKLKRIFTGTYDYNLKPKDVEICRELKYAQTLIAICEK